MHVEGYGRALPEKEEEGICFVQQEGGGNAKSIRMHLDWRIVVDSAVKGAVCLDGERHWLRTSPLQLVQRLALGVPPEVLPLLVEAEVR